MQIGKRVLVRPIQTAQFDLARAVDDQLIEWGIARTRTWLLRGWPGIGS